MSLWLQVRRTRACAATVLVVAVALSLAGERSLPLPNLLGGPPLAVPLTLLMPLAVGSVVALGLTSGDPRVEAVASRPLRLLDVAYALSAATLALAAGRNALGYVGLTLIGRCGLGPHAAALLPAGFTVAAALFGSGADRQPRWWAWPLVAADDPLSWGSAVVLLLLGAAVALRRSDSATADR